MVLVERFFAKKKKKNKQKNMETATVSKQGRYTRNYMYFLKR